MQPGPQVRSLPGPVRTGGWPGDAQGPTLVLAQIRRWTLGAGSPLLAMAEAAGSSLPGATGRDHRAGAGTGQSAGRGGAEAPGVSIVSVPRNHHGPPRRPCGSLGPPPSPLDLAVWRGGLALITRKTDKLSICRGHG